MYGNSFSAPVTPTRPRSAAGFGAEQSDSEFTELGSQIEIDPVLATGLDLGGLNASLGNAFQPMDSIEDPANYIFDEEDQEDDDDDDEDMLRVEDFINFGESSDDDDDKDSPTSPAFASESDVKTDGGSKGKSKDSRSLASSPRESLTDFNPTVMTSFRRSQFDKAANEPNLEMQHAMRPHLLALQKQQAYDYASKLPQRRKRNFTEAIDDMSQIEGSSKRRVVDHL